MNKKFLVMALTGALTLAACSQGPTNTGSGSGSSTNPGGGSGSSTTPVPTNAPVINVTSPAQGSTLTDPKEVVVVGNVVSQAPLASLKINNVVVPVNAGLTNNFNVALPIDAAVKGAFPVVVVATDTAGKTATYTLNLNVNRTVASGASVSVGPDLGKDGREASTKAGGARDIAQSGVDASGPTSDVYTYVKGVVTITATPPAGARRLEVYVAATPDTPAIDNLVDTANPTGPVTATYDSRRRGQYEGVPLFLFSRVTAADGTQTLTSKRIVADNTAPEPADPEFQGAVGPGNNVIKNYGTQNSNYARGSIRIFTSNTDLRDLPNGPSNVAGVPNKLPSGFDSISYYAVPDNAANRDAIENAGTAQAKVNAIKAAAAAATKDFGKVATASSGNNDFSVNLKSGTAGGPAEVTDGKYRIYTVTRDQVGNEVSSPQFESVIFDNVGPTIGSIQLIDDSPLPFPSRNPTKYISDFFRVGSTGGVDQGDPALPDGTPGIGIINTAKLNIGGLQLTVGQRFDSNLIADGQYTVDASQYTDVLGNPPQTSQQQSVIIDNTDPVVNFSSPDQGAVLTSGQDVSVQTTANDLTSGIYKTVLFWNDFTDASRVRSSGFVAAPVEFARFQFPDETKDAQGANSRWKAVYPLVNGTSGAQTMWLQGLAIDNAGNASIIRREVRVAPKVATYTVPSLGDFDVHAKDITPAFAPPATTRTASPVRPADGTASGFGLEAPQYTPIDAEIESEIALRVPGTAPALPNASAGERVEAVKMYGEFNADLWNRIVYYQTGQGTAPAAPAAGAPEQTDPSLTRNGNTDPAASDLSQRRSVQWRNINDAATGPWLSLGNTASSSEFYTANTSVNNPLAFDYVRDGIAKPFYANVGAAPAAGVPFYKYDALAGIVYDTAGFHSDFAEGVVKHP